MKELKVKETEGDDKMRKAVEQIKEVSLGKQETNNETSAKLHHLPGIILLQYSCIAKLKASKCSFIYLHFLNCFFTYFLVHLRF